ncbi:Cysteine-rich secretory protein family protein [Sphingomonas laterariae]|uniref:Cysteine-rich secretory protein family protein n=2 Tax=Edaphosphingomonas laterariae TaxID=861865 RepID=A0A239H9J1_9SPHN|nr:Cysteine-rich secretory protein family protein [Sphingomonas laterariae]
MAGLSGRMGRLTRTLALVALAAASPLLQGAIDQTANSDQRLLASHNRERAMLGIPPLAWNEGLARDAAAWGRHLTRVGYLVHYPDNPNDPDPQGENLWAGTRGYYSIEDMVGLWIAEKKNYRAGVFPANSRTNRLDDVAHYTQVMWRSSTDVGCAVVRGRQDDFLVCRYSEGGNVLGERPF